MLIEAEPPKMIWEKPKDWGGIGDDPKKWCEKIPGFCSVVEEGGNKRLVLADRDREAGKLGWVVDVTGVCREVLTKVGKKAFEEYFVYCLDSVNQGLSENVNRSTDLGNFKITGDKVDLVINTPSGEERFPIGGQELVDIVLDNGKIVVLAENDLAKKPDPNSEIIILGLVGAACVLGVLGVGKLGYEVSKAVKRNDEEFIRNVDRNFKNAKNAAIEKEAESIAIFLRKLDQKIVDITQEAAGEGVVVVNKADIRRRDAIIESSRRKIADLERQKAEAIARLNSRVQTTENQRDSYFDVEKSRRADRHVDRV